jgi:hypothetical protein
MGEQYFKPYGEGARHGDGCSSPPWSMDFDVGSGVRAEVTAYQSEGGRLSGFISYRVPRNVRIESMPSAVVVTDTSAATENVSIPVTVSARRDDSTQKIFVNFDSAALPAKSFEVLVPPLRLEGSSTVEERLTYKLVRETVWKPLCQ